MTRFAMAEARRNLGELVNRVAYGGERVAIGRRSKDLAVLISVQDAELLETLEDLADARVVRQALAEGGESIPWDEAKKRLGL